MHNDFFMPPGAAEVAPSQLVQLPINALMLACREARFRRLIHWNGLAQSGGLQGAFTSKLHTQSVVFGFEPGEVQVRDEGLSVRCALHAFPEPEDARCEQLTLAAAVLTGSPDYPNLVRYFSQYPFLLGRADEQTQRLSGLFQIAWIEFRVNKTGTRLEVRLEGPRERKRLCTKGLAYPEQPGTWLVSPGDWEECVPALPLARVWGEVLTAAITAACGEAPGGFQRQICPGTMESDTSPGGLVPDPQNTWEQDWYVWGEAGPLDLPEDVASAPCWNSHRLDALTEGSALGVDLRPGLLVLTGFLGSGKTTVLNQLIEWQRGRERCVGVIQNELGATGVDARLLGDAASVVAMDEGCVCCTLAGNLGAGIRSLQAEANPECILLETTGLANPLNLQAEMGEIREIARLDAVVTVVDARHGLGILAESDIARDQVIAADLIILNKCDLASEDARGALRERLCALNPRAVVHEAIRGALPPGVLAHLERAPAGLSPQVPRHTDHLTEGYSSVRFFLPQPVDLPTLNRLVRECPGNPFRIKGLVRTSAQGLPQALHCVGGEVVFEEVNMSEPGLFAEHVRSSESHGHEAPQPELNAAFVVCIGRNLDRESLLQHWSCVGALEAEAHPAHTGSQA